MLHALVSIALAAGLSTTLAAGAPIGVSSASPPALSAYRPKAAADVSFTIVKTGGGPTREGLSYSGGSFWKKVNGSFSAFLVKHNGALLLFDTGLGSKTAEQIERDMPWWGGLVFSGQEPIVPARKQLSEDGIGSIERIVLSHSHWDHASGLVDFPGAEIQVPEEELAFIRQPQAKMNRAWPSQVSSPDLKWKAMQFQPTPYEGYERSLDMFGDGSVVFVPMFGHTPGSVGMFVTVTSGKRYFFIGDTVWNASALAESRPKFWLGSAMADLDADRVQAEIEKVRAVMMRNPGMVIIPAHDGDVQGALGYFPAWVR
ncbi:MAG: MBL fold metallo-hydrolase [Burkholderiaceae bacterium]